MKSKNILFIITIVLMITILACAPGSGTHTQGNPAGFFTGIWHGWIAPITLVWGLFEPAIRVYETSNTGWWYDFGFYIAIIGGFGSFSLIRKRDKDK